MGKNKKIFNISENAVVTVYDDLSITPNSVLLPKQIHGDDIVEIITGKENLENCDALITNNKNFLLGVRTADCAPICFADGEKIGIDQISWREMYLSMIEKMLHQFDLKNLNIFVGHFMHYNKIKKDFCFDKIQEKFGDKYFIESEGKITFLFKNAIMSLLPKNTQFDSRNTFLDLSLPSFRRDKTSERLITVI